MFWIFYVGFCITFILDYSSSKLPVFLNTAWGGCYTFSDDVVDVDCPSK
jgi:hypothetical protein